MWQCVTSPPDKVSKQQRKYDLSPTNPSPRQHLLTPNANSLSLLSFSLPKTQTHEAPEHIERPPTPFSPTSHGAALAWEREGGCYLQNRKVSQRDEPGLFG